MSNRVKGCVVAFEHDLGEENAGDLLGAIRQLRGVAAVHPEPLSHDDWMERARVKHELRDKLWDLWKNMAE